MRPSPASWIVLAFCLGSCAVDGRDPSIQGVTLPGAAGSAADEVPEAAGAGATPAAASPASGLSPDAPAAEGAAAVVAGPPRRLVFEGLALEVLGGARFPDFTVAAVDAAGTIVGSVESEVALQLRSAGGGRLRGFSRVRASGGVAPFEGVSIDTSGDDYVLEASTPGLESAVSSPIRFSKPAFENVARTLSGQRVRSLALDGGGTTLYARIDTGVVRSENFRSPGNDVVWNDTGFESPRITGLLVADPGKPGVLYTIAGPGDLVAFPFIGKSLDGGNTWQRLPSPSQGRGVRTLVFDPDGITSLACGPGGIHRSTDGGESWVDAGFGRACEALASEPAAPFGLFARGVEAGSMQRLWRSDDRGASWAPVLDFADLGIVGNLVASSEALFVATSRGLWRSIDRGASWTSDALLTSLVAASPGDASHVYASAAGGLRVSTDGGATFGIDSDRGFGRLQSLLVDPTDSSRAYAATDQGLFVTVDGGESWSDASEQAGFGHQQQETVAISPNTPNIVLTGGRGGLFRSADSGQTWLRTLSAAIFGLAFDPVDPAVGFACDLGGLLYRSSDAGSTWDLGVWVENGPYCYDVLLVGTSMWVSTVGGVSRSLDGGVTWAATSLTFPTYSLAADADGSTLYAGTGAGTYKSTDAGASWALMNSADFATSFVIDPLTPSRVYASISCGAAVLGATGRGGIKISEDQGRQWNFLVPEGPCIEDLAVGPEGQLYAVGSGEGGSFRVRPSSDAAWLSGGSGLNGIALKMDITADAQTVFVATSDGLYRSTTGGY